MRIQNLEVILQPETDPPQLKMTIGIDGKKFGAVTVMPSDYNVKPETFKIAVQQIFQAVINRIDSEEKFPGCWSEKNTSGGMDKEGRVTMDESEEADAKG